MRKQLSSLDLHYLIKELHSLKDSRIDKISQPSKEIIIISFYKTNYGKKILKIEIGKSIHMESEKEAGETLGFGMLLRKHLDGFFLVGIGQVNSERIAKFTFSMKDSVKFLYIELFGSGNAILCDENNVIINSLEHHEFRERTIKPKLKYTYPMMRYNFLDLDENSLKLMFKESKKQSVVVSLATELGFGGVYAEEICLLSSVEKSKDPKTLANDEIIAILKIIKNLSDKKIDAKIAMDDIECIDYMPFDLEYYKNYHKQDYETFNDAVSYFFSQYKEKEENEHDRKINSLKRIIEEQKSKLGELKKGENETREKAEHIYQNYTLIKEILEELGKASKKHSWKEIKEKLKDHKIIKELNEKERKIIIEI